MNETKRGRGRPTTYSHDSLKPLVEKWGITIASKASGVSRTHVHNIAEVNEWFIPTGETIRDNIVELIK